MGLVHGEAPGFVMLPLQLDGAGALIVSTLPAGTNAIGNVNAKAGASIFAVSSVIAVRINQAATAVNFNLASNPVPAGTLWVLTSLAAQDATAACPRIVFDVSGFTLFDYNVATPANIWHTEHPWIVLAAGQQIRAGFIGIGIGDNVFFDFMGFTMAA